VNSKILELDHGANDFQVVVCEGKIGDGQDFDVLRVLQSGETAWIHPATRHAELVEMGKLSDAVPKTFPVVLGCVGWVLASAVRRLVGGVDGMDIMKKVQPKRLDQERWPFGLRHSRSLLLDSPGCEIVEHSAALQFAKRRHSCCLVSGSLQSPGKSAHE